MTLKTGVIIRGVNPMVRHDSIRYRFSYPAIRYLPIPQKIIQYYYDSIQEYIDQYRIRYRSISINISIL